jgi:hypothetical protein
MRPTGAKKASRARPEGSRLRQGLASNWGSACAGAQILCFDGTRTTHHDGLNSDPAGSTSVSVSVPTSVPVSVPVPVSAAVSAEQIQAPIPAQNPDPDHSIRTLQSGLTRVPCGLYLPVGAIFPPTPSHLLSIHGWGLSGCGRRTPERCHSRGKELTNLADSGEARPGQSGPCRAALGERRIGRLARRMPSRGRRIVCRENSSPIKSRS